MKRLYLLRHAKSSWDSPATRDFDRPLAPRGERDAPKIGKLLRSTGAALDRVVSSPALRARQTAELALHAAKFKGELVLDESIYGASALDLLDFVSRLVDGAESVLLIGHNPGFEELAGILCGSRMAPSNLRFPTAALACFDVAATRWSEVGAGAATLQWLVVPKIL